MNKRLLGRTGIDAGSLVLGGNVFGWTADRDTSFAILDRFVDGGLRTIDTADVYSSWVPGNRGGESETIIGEWMASRKLRDKVVIVTKVGSEMGAGKKGLSADYITQAIEASLWRLKTDYVDVYLAHWPDPDTPYEETLSAFQTLREAGKIRASGGSNLDATQLRESLVAAAQHELGRYEVLQPEYNLYDRSGFEGPLQDLTIAEGIGVITYFSLAKGFLTGKYRTENDLRKSPRGGAVKSYLNERGRRILAALDSVAAEVSAAPGEVALAWIAAQPGVAAPIASATSVEQADSLVRAASLSLSPAQIARLTTAGE